eukprot:jgi/Chlat1/6527/Chrsp45S06073
MTCRPSRPVLVDVSGLEEDDMTVYDLEALVAEHYLHQTHHLIRITHLTDLHGNKLLGTKRVRQLFSENGRASSELQLIAHVQGYAEPALWGSIARQAQHARKLRCCVYAALFVGFLFLLICAVTAYLTMFRSARNETAVRRNLSRIEDAAERVAGVSRRLLMVAYRRLH